MFFSLRRHTRVYSKGSESAAATSRVVPRPDELLLEVCHSQRLTVGEHNFQNFSRRLAVFYRFECDADFVSGLESVLAPTFFYHVGGVVGLSDPVYDGTVGIL